MDERNIYTPESQRSRLTTINIKITNIRIHVQCTMPYLVPRTCAIPVINTQNKPAKHKNHEDFSFIKHKHFLDT
jgi:hypothetical protein